MSRLPLLLVMLGAPAASAGPPAAGSSSPVPPAAPAVRQEQPAPFERRPVYEGTPLSLDTALDEALRANPTLVALKRQFEAARHRPDQERFLAAPTFEAQIWQWPIDTINPANTNMYMFTVGQDLPGRGKRRLRAAVVETEAALAENDIAVQAREVVDQVRRAYAELFLNRKAIAIHHDGVDLMRQFADISSVKYATGRMSQGDVVKAVVELSMLHGDLIRLHERADRAEARLNTLLDRDPDASIGPLLEPRERVILPPPAELQRIALERQPELRGAALGVERAEAALAVARSDERPDFFVSGGYMLMPGRTDAWTANVGVTWPTAPWSRRRLDARTAEAAAEIDAARARQRAARNAVEYAVQDAYIRVKAAGQRASLLRTSVVPQSAQALEVSRAAYQTDQADFLALIDNQRGLLEVRLEYYRALSDLEQALADLERAVGTPLDPSMLAVARTGRNEQ